MAALRPNLVRNAYIALLVLILASMAEYCLRFGQYKALRCSEFSALCFCKYVSSTQRKELMNLLERISNILDEKRASWLTYHLEQV